MSLDWVAMLFCAHPTQKSLELGLINSKFFAYFMSFDFASLDVAIDGHMGHTQSGSQLLNEIKFIISFGWFGRHNIWYSNGGNAMWPIIHDSRILNNG